MSLCLKLLYIGGLRRSIRLGWALSKSKVFEKRSAASLLIGIFSDSILETVSRNLYLEIERDDEF